TKKLIIINDINKNNINNMTLGELLIGFFKMFLNFDNNEYIISITNNGFKFKNDCIHSFDIKEHQKYLIIQDPIYKNKNVTKNVTKVTLKIIKNEMKRCLDIYNYNIIAH